MRDSKPHLHTQGKPVNDKPKNFEQLTTVLVTPKMAQAWLDADGRSNRVINQSKVDEYVSEIEAGLFVFSYACLIMFDSEGLNIDGQHRLSAIVKSNRSQWMHVVSGVDRASVMRIIDRGGRRLAHIFQVEGLADADTLVSMARACLVCGREGVTRAQSRAVEEFVKGNLVLLSKYARIRRMKGAAAAMAAAFVMCEKSGWKGVEEAAQRFFARDFPTREQDAMWLLDNRRVDLINSSLNAHDLSALRFRLAVSALRMNASGNVMSKLQDAKDRKNFSI